MIPQKHLKRKKAFAEKFSLDFFVSFCIKAKEKGKGVTGEFTGLGHFADNHIK